MVGAGVETEAEWTWSSGGELRARAPPGDSRLEEEQEEEEETYRASPGC